jgi:hypothetical protein
MLNDLEGSDEPICYILLWMITTFIASKNSKRKHWDLGGVRVFFEVKFHDLTKIIIIKGGKKTQFF